MNFEVVAYDIICTDDDVVAHTIRATDKFRLEHYRKSPGAWEVVPLYREVQPTPID